MISHGNIIAGIAGMAERIPNLKYAIVRVTAFTLTHPCVLPPSEATKYAYTAPETHTHYRIFPHILNNHSLCVTSHYVFFCVCCGNQPAVISVPAVKQTPTLATCLWPTFWSSAPNWCASLMAVASATRPLRL